MVNRLYLPVFLFLFFFSKTNAQTGCPNCSVSLPSLPADTIYISDAPDGVAGQYYNADISFRMPKTTTPVNAEDPSTPPGLTISQIDIVALLNVPPGLSWEANEMQFDPSSQTDGCVKFCGTPLQPGFYEVQVFVTAEVLLITESTSFSFSIFIAPANSATVGFSMANSSGCGEVTVDFTNNLPSNGQAGFTYIWDFGNGETSTQENPPAINYTEPGIYEVNYQVTVDTFGYQLTTLQVLAAGCEDFSIPPIFSPAPDLYLRIEDPNGDPVFTTSPITNAAYPTVWNVNLMLGPGNYTVEVRDDDSIGSDGCGTVTFNQATTDTLEDGELMVFVNIIHPVTTLQSTDTVVVFENPAPPIISPDGLVEICAGESVELLANYPDNLQWYQDTVTLLGENEPLLIVASNGDYWAEYTSDEGCKSQSEQVTVAFSALPVSPAFQIVGNLLLLSNPDLLPVEYSLQWLLSGVEIPGANGPEYCITEPGVALYSLQVTDLNSGCTNEFAIGVGFDPSYECDMLLGSEESFLVEKSLTVFPNPAAHFITLEFESTTTAPFEISLNDAFGRSLQTWGNQHSSGVFSKKIDLGGLPAGIYFLQVKMEDGNVVRRFVKK